MKTLLAVLLLSMVACAAQTTASVDHGSLHHISTLPDGTDSYSIDFEKANMVSGTLYYFNFTLPPGRVITRFEGNIAASSPQGCSTSMLGLAQHTYDLTTGLYAAIIHVGSNSGEAGQVMLPFSWNTPVNTDDGNMTYRINITATAGCYGPVPFDYELQGMIWVR